MPYWIFKSEPSTFSVDDLSRCKNQTTPWDGIRNYQVRNFIRDAIKLNDTVFFYHSSCDEPGVVGVMRVVREAYPDDTAFDPQSEYFDPKSTPEHPRWFRVDVQLIEQFSQVFSLKMIRSHPDLQQLLVVRKGNRLSITPVDDASAQVILKCCQQLANFVHRI